MFIFTKNFLKRAFISMQEDFIQKIIGNCRIEKLLGRGGMGSVYLGQHLGLDIPVAVKVLSPNLVASEELIQRFFLEARAAAKIDSPYVVRVMQVAQDHGVYFIQMEFVPGKSLAQLLHTESLLALRECCNYLYQIATGLQTAHEAGIIHRDIKPENILITPKGQVKITDFGLAKSLQAMSNLTQAGQILGTPQYMSPEQCSGKESDARSDIYSLGITFYYMITGKQPFYGETPMSLLLKHLQGQFIPPRQLRAEISEKLEQITLRMMALQPDERYQNLQQLLTDLFPILQEYNIAPTFYFAMPQTSYMPMTMAAPALDKPAVSALDKPAMSALDKPQSPNSISSAHAPRPIMPAQETSPTKNPIGSAAYLDPQAKTSPIENIAVDVQNNIFGAPLPNLSIANVTPEGTPAPLPNPSDSSSSLAHIPTPIHTPISVTDISIASNPVASEKMPAEEAKPIISNPYVIASTHCGSEHNYSGSITRTNLNQQSTLHNAERRHLIILCCEIGQVSSWLEQNDPSKWEQIISEYENLCNKIIKPWDGYLAQSLDATLFIYFGFPKANEDDAQRAMSAGFALLKQLKAWREAENFPCSIRLGIHCGMAIMGERKGRKIALGEASNIVSGIKDISQDQILISHDMQRLVTANFNTELVGNYPLRGLATPMSVYCVTSPRNIASQEEMFTCPAFVGREQEVGLLQQRWDQVIEGTGQIVMIQGEPGIGKNRLIKEFKRQIQTNYHLAECRGSAYDQFTAWYAISTMLPGLFGWQDSDDFMQRYTKMETMLSHYDLPLSDAVPLLATLFAPDSQNYNNGNTSNQSATNNQTNFEKPNSNSSNNSATEIVQNNLSNSGFQTILEHKLSPSSRPKDQIDTDISPQQQKQKTQEILLSLILQMARQQPVLWIGRELQWWDPTSLEFLFKLLQQAENSNIFVLLTMRNDFKLCSTAHINATYLTLTKLTHKQCESMIASLLDTKKLEPSMIETIITKSDGIPLFIEELTKMIVESTTAQMSEGNTLNPQAVIIPNSLQGLLMARLDRMGIAKEVLQVASVVGREFDEELLYQFQLWDKNLLSISLASLTEAQLLQRKGLEHCATYRFKHLLIQEAAYQSLIKSDQQKYHQKIGEILEAKGVANTKPELVAHHYGLGTTPYKAISLWQEAGQRCTNKSSSEEALYHFRHALELLPTITSSKERDQRWLQIQVAMGFPLIMTKGYASPDVQKHYEETYELALKQADSEILFSVLRGLWAFYFVRGDANKSNRLATQLLAIAKNKTAWWLTAQYCLGNSQFFVGDFTGSMKCWQNIMSKYDPVIYPPSALSLDIDVGVISLVRMAYTLAVWGDETNALKKCGEAIQLAHKINHNYSLAGGLCQVAWFYNFLEQWDKAQQYSEEALKITQERGFNFWRIISSTLLGHALIGQKKYTDGVARMEQSLQEHAKVGAGLLRPIWLAMLAIGYQQQGKQEQSLSAISQAIAQAEKYPQTLYQVEVYYQKACLCLANHNQDEANQYFNKAYHLAQTQNAKMLIQRIEQARQNI